MTLQLGMFTEALIIVFIGNLCSFPLKCVDW